MVCRTLATLVSSSFARSLARSSPLAWLDSWPDLTTENSAATNPELRIRPAGLAPHGEIRKIAKSRGIIFYLRKFGLSSINCVLNRRSDLARHLAGAGCFMASLG